MDELLLFFFLKTQSRRRKSGSRIFAEDRLNENPKKCGFRNFDRYRSANNIFEPFRLTQLQE